MLNGKKVSLRSTNVILPYRRTSEPKFRWIRTMGDHKVIELNAEARQRAAFKRVLRCHNVIPSGPAVA